MEGGFFEDLGQLEFFTGAQDEKQDSCMPVVSTPAQLTPPDHLSHGIYQNEESVDFSSIIEAYNAATVTTTSSVASTVTSASPQNPSSARQEAITTDTSFHSFAGYHDLVSLGHPSMYGSENYGSMHGQVDMTPSPPSMAVDCIGVPTTPSPHVVQIDNSSMSSGNFTALRPAPGKAQRSGKASKKHAVDKNSLEYRQKRDRNNVAVRKSREKSKIRVQDTEKRVRELEEENTQLQSKIALLSKELNVLKSLFTSAGVSQPPSFKGERRMGQK